MILSSLPVAPFPDVFLSVFRIPQRQTEVEVLEPKGSVVIADHLHVRTHFISYLIQRAVDVSIIHRKHANAKQSRQSAREFVAVDCTVLSNTQW